MQIDSLRHYGGGEIREATHSKLVTNANGPQQQGNEAWTGSKIYGIGATCAQSAQQIQIDTNGGPNRHKTAHIQIDTNSATLGIQIDTDSPFCTILISKQIQLTPINWYYPNTGLTGYQP